MIGQVNTLSREVEWGKEAPKGKFARRDILSKFGPGCFIEPQELKFPICNIRGEISCPGIHAALRRSLQYKYESIAKKALEAGKKYGCSWAKGAFLEGNNVEGGTKMAKMQEIALINPVAGRVRTCVRYTQTAKGRRCAKYSGVSGLGQPTGRVCVTYKRGPSGQKRCARFAGTAGTKSGLGRAGKLRRIA